MDAGGRTLSWCDGVWDAGRTDGTGGWRERMGSKLYTCMLT